MGEHTHGMPVTANSLDTDSLAALRERIGDEHLGKRLRAQVDRSVHITGLGRGGLHIENLSPVIKTIGLALRLGRLLPRGRRNALRHDMVENTVAVRNLPRDFDGLRILHLTDLHLDAYRGFGQMLAEAISTLKYDVCVLTGDFRFLTTGPHDQVAVELAALAPALKCQHGAFGILGNHDFIEFVPMLESAGIRMLLNEAVELAGADGSIWLVGLDDAHFYGVHNLEKALRHVNPAQPRILLVHSPEVIPEASESGFALYLSGHTHGGQICLPGGWPPLVNAHCPRRYATGAWQHNGMSGYTSRGAGSSGIFARFNCPPEITTHILTHATD